jgi:hypothetical protein
MSLVRCTNGKAYLLTDDQNRAVNFENTASVGPQHARALSPQIVKSIFVGLGEQHPFSTLCIVPNHS